MSGVLEQRFPLWGGAQRQPHSAPPPPDPPAPRAWLTHSPGQCVHADHTLQCAPPRRPAAVPWLLHQGPRHPPDQKSAHQPPAFWLFPKPARSTPAYTARCGVAAPDAPLLLPPLLCRVIQLNMGLVACFWYNSGFVNPVPFQEDDPYGSPYP